MSGRGDAFFELISNPRTGRLAGFLFYLFSAAVGYCCMRCRKNKYPLQLIPKRNNARIFAVSFVSYLSSLVQRNALLGRLSASLGLTGAAFIVELTSGYTLVASGAGTPAAPDVIIIDNDGAALAVRALGPVAIVVATLFLGLLATQRERAVLAHWGTQLLTIPAVSACCKRDELRQGDLMTVKTNSEVVRASRKALNPTARDRPPAPVLTTACSSVSVAVSSVIAYSSGQNCGLNSDASSGSRLCVLWIATA